jgi:hypothetical protein
MHRTVTCCLALALGCAPVVAAAGALSSVKFEVGGGWASLGGDEGDRSGGGGFLGASVPLRPWFGLGGELGGYGFGEARPWIMLDSIDSSDRATLGTLMATFSVQPPVRTGVSPFLVSQAGVALLRLGEAREYVPWSPGDYARRGSNDLVFCSAIGVGLQGAWPRPAPGFELSVRSVMLGGGTPRTMVVPRVSLTY